MSERPGARLLLRGGDASPARVTWGPRHIVYGVLLAVAGIMLSLTTISVPVTAAFGEDSAEAHAANAVSQTVFEVLAAAVVLLIVSRTGGQPGALGLRRPRAPEDDVFAAPGREPAFPWSRIGRLVVGGLVASYAALWLYVAVVQTFDLGILEPDRQIPKDYYTNPFVIAALGIGIAVAAPIAEELFFRGFLFGGLRPLTGFVPAALISGLLFAMAHFQLGLIIPFATIGIIFAYLYERSGSLVPSMTVHFLFNSMQFLILVLVPESR